MKDYLSIYIKFEVWKGCSAPDFSLSFGGSMKRIGTILILTAVVFQSLVFAQTDRKLERENDKTAKRTALVIGNSDYLNARKLTNPVNDATDMTKALTEVGFEVISGTNLSLKQMTDKVREFGDKLKANGGVGLFYYAGHGVQVNNKNYLIPVEADVSREDEIDFAALNFEIVLRKMATANNGLNIVILDACRNNPFARSWNRDTSDGGLAQISAPTGTFIGYATSPDKTASDGDGRNGLYTTQLLKIINQPNLKIEEAFKQVTIAVDKASSGNQIPWVSSSLRGEFYFKAEKSVVVTKNTTEPTILAKNKTEQEKEAWDLVKNSNDAEDFRYFLREFPNAANTEKAKIRLEELVWLSVRSSTDKGKVQAYLSEFPTGANVGAARIKLRQLETATTTPTTTQNPTINNQNTDDALAELEAWNKIKTSANQADFQNFLQKYPNGAFANQARTKIGGITDAEWNRVRSSKDPNVYKSYIAANPNSQYTAEARTRMNMLVASMVAYEQIRESKDVEDFKAYAVKYPEGVYVEDAKAMYEPPKIGTMRRNSNGMEFMYIPAGDFMMGDSTKHKVTISQAFFMGRTEVTQAQWQAVMGNNPSSFKDCPNCPVESVSWEEAQQFVSKLNGQNDGYKYRLPTEAEWEYACRAGTTGDYAGSIDSMGWYDANSGKTTHQVGQKQANAWGLYDMHGNVWEWVEDWYGEYPSGSVTNPTGASSGSDRVIRGGGWYILGRDLRSAIRSYYAPSFRSNYLGFRLVRN